LYSSKYGRDYYTMSEYKQRKGKVTGVPSVPKSVNRELQNYLRSLSELIETKVGLRGNALDRHVTLRELQDAGVVDRIDSAKNFNVNAVNAQNRGFTNTGTLRMFTSQKQRPFESAILTFKHNLGRVPDLVQVCCYCIADADTWKKGDILILPGSSRDDGSSGSDLNEGMSIQKTATEIICYCGENGFASVTEKDGTGQSDLLGDDETTADAASWEVEVKAFVFESSKQGN
jgi:hypothetical protein